MIGFAETECLDAVYVPCKRPSAPRLRVSKQDAASLPIVNTNEDFFSESTKFNLQSYCATPLLPLEEQTSLLKQARLGKNAELIMRLGKDFLSQSDRKSLQKIINTGESAKEKLIKTNIRLVVYTARKYAGFDLPFADVIQEGCIGLLKAIDRYDFQRNIKFSTYAVWWIRQSVVRAMQNCGRAIRIPVHRLEEIQKVTKTYFAMTQELQRDPTPQEIAEKMNLPLETAKNLLFIVNLQPVSLDAPTGDDNDSSLGEIIADDCSVESAVEETVKREQINRALKKLSSTEETVVRMRFGIGYERTYTLEEVGKQFHLSRERIRQIEKKALGKLRKPSVRKLLSGLLEENCAAS